MNQGLGLLFNGPGNIGMAMTQVAHGNSSQKIRILVALVIKKLSALPFYKRASLAKIGLKNMIFCFLNAQNFPFLLHFIG
jgi:hypothetical protein